jgi:tellurite resistance protein TerC
MGLRQLYFLLGGLLDRLRYLHYGIAFILAFIGVKLIFHAMHENELPFINGGQHIEWVPDISTWMSLGVIVASMVVATVASLVASARERAAGPVAGSAGDTVAPVTETPVAAAEAVADEKGTPATVERPDDSRS